MSGARILTIDIETSPNLGYFWAIWKENISLNQIREHTQILCFAAKWYGEKEIIFHSVQGGRGIMLDALWELLNEADIVVHWNGSSFDIPHINRELIQNGYNPPSPYKQIDLMLVARKHFRFVSNSLANVVSQLGIGRKVKHAGFEMWIGCMAGDTTAWADMERYNRGDVRITERALDKFLPWIPSLPHAGLYSGDMTSCGRGHCGGKLQRRGYATTSLGKYQRFQCQKCGGWSRGKTSLVMADTRPAG